MGKEVGRTWLYKGKDSEIFEGDAVAEAMKDGWVDCHSKTKKAGRPVKEVKK